MEACQSISTPFYWQLTQPFFSIGRAEFVNYNWGETAWNYNNNEIVIILRHIIQGWLGGWVTTTRIQHSYLQYLQPINKYASYHNGAVVSNKSSRCTNWVGRFLPIIDELRRLVKLSRYVVLNNLPRDPQ